MVINVKGIITNEWEANGNFLADEEIFTKSKKTKAQKPTFSADKRPNRIPIKKAKKRLFFSGTKKLRHISKIAHIFRFKKDVCKNAAIIKIKINTFIKNS